METLVDVAPLPAETDRATWAWEGLPTSHGWESFGDFARSHFECGQQLREQRGHREYELKERLKLMSNNGKRMSSQAVHAVYRNYCAEYLSLCSVSSKTRDCLHALKEKYTLGIVSNHIIKGALQSILEKEDILEAIDFVIVSIDLGWKKPCDKIYRAARDKAGMSFESILFVGDDLLHDYQCPRELGMQAILYDPTGKHRDCPHRISSLPELPQILR